MRDNYESRYFGCISNKSEFRRFYPSMIIRVTTGNNDEAVSSIIEILRTTRRITRNICIIIENAYFFFSRLLNHLSRENFTTFL